MNPFSVERQYQPDIDRQLQALQIVLEEVSISPDPGKDKEAKRLTPDKDI